MHLQIALTGEIEARLCERAAQEGKDPAALALEAIRDKLAEPNGRPPEAGAEARLVALNRFVARARRQSERLPAGFVADDSRESVYEGRGE